MECPICGSKAVTASTCISNYVELAQQGRDPYDLIYDQPRAECRSCGHVFDAEQDSQEQSESNI